MKCIKLTNNEIKRVANELATLAVEQGKAVYTSKKEWKATRKPVVVVATTTEVNTEDHATKVAKQARKAETKARSLAKKNAHKKGGN